MQPENSLGKKSGEGPREETNEINFIQSLPSITSGINCVEKPGKMPVFQQLVASELNSGGGHAVWIDTGNEASTYALSSFGGPDVMESVDIGRAFTPFQHHSLVQRLEEFIQKDTEILVLPRVSGMYVSGQLKEWEARELFEETWNQIKEVQRKHELKVLVSATSGSGEFIAQVEESADRFIQVENNGSGRKYSSDDFDQLVYTDDGNMQTTLSFWNEKAAENREKEVAQVKV